MGGGVGGGGLKYFIVRSVLSRGDLSWSTVVRYWHCSNHSGLYYKSIVICNYTQRRYYIWYNDKFDKIRFASNFAIISLFHLKLNSTLFPVHKFR